MESRADLEEQERLTDEPGQHVRQGVGRIQRAELSALPHAVATTQGPQVGSRGASQPGIGVGLDQGYEVERPVGSAGEGQAPSTLEHHQNGEQDRDHDGYWKPTIAATVRF